MTPVSLMPPENVEKDVEKDQCNEMGYDMVKKYVSRMLIFMLVP